MTQYSKFNIIYRLQKWMDSVPGQTFLNYAYSWGASVVIAGTLFKLTHLPGANLMLFLGMGTEVVVFFLSAFDRPFDKTTDGMELQTHLRRTEDEEGEDLDNLDITDSGETPEGLQVQTVPVQGQVQGGTIIIGGGVVGGNAEPGTQPIEGEMPEGNIAAAVGQTVVGGGGVIVGGDGGSWINDQQQITPEMAEATGNYVEELKRLTEMLVLVNEQSARLARDSEEMENLNRTLTGISKVYEMQLKGASQQIGTIDQINEQSKKMAEQIEQLNKIYARMIEAMTVNMRATAPNTGDNNNG